MKPTRAIFTIVTKSYLAYARVMAKELSARHPETPFYVFLADRPDGCFQPEQEPFIVIPLEEFFPAELMPTMTGYYTAYEFCNALKPFAHLHLATKIGVERWFYLDSDISLTGSFESLFNQLNGASILLVPHILRADVVPEAEELELIFLRMGIYNGGCLGVSHSERALVFLQWWKQRLVWHCLHNTPGLEVDQTWLNFVPALFPDCKITHDPGVNVGYWNMHERPLTKNVEGGFSVLGHPVPFIHFSGWDWRNPDRLTKHPNLKPGLIPDAWLQASGEFAEKLRPCGVETCSQWPYSFARAKNGHVLTPSMRRKYWTRLRGKEKSDFLPSIFDKPEMFEDTKAPETKPLSLWGVTRMWLGAVRRCLLPD